MCHCRLPYTRSHICQLCGLSIKPGRANVLWYLACVLLCSRAAGPVQAATFMPPGNAQCNNQRSKADVAPSESFALNDAP